MTKTLPLLFLLFGLLYCNKPALSEDKTCTSLEECTPLAEQGDKHAQFYIGHSYHFGNGVPQDFSLANHWYKLSADQGHIGAQINGGQMCSLEESLSNNKKQKMLDAWVKKAHDGNALVQNCLGNLYHNGDGVLINNQLAVKWYQQSAEQGYADAQYSLARMYYSGLGVEKSFKGALKWFQLSAEQNFNQSWFMIGRMYENGEGVDQDYSRAGGKYSISCLLGFKPACAKISDPNFRKKLKNK